MPDFFADVPDRIPFGGLDSDEALSFKVYEPDRVVLGKRMEDHLRAGVCFWHSFAWDGRDMFGIGTMDRPWLTATDDEMAARPDEDGRRVRVFLEAGYALLLLPRSRRLARGRQLPRLSATNLDALADDAAGYQERTGVRLLWGTANLFTHPRYQAGAATNPDPAGVRVRGRAGQAHARGHAAPGRRELRPVGRSRGLRHAAQYRPASRGRRSSLDFCTSSPSTRRRSASPDSC